jgi:GTPase KRas
MTESMYQQPRRVTVVSEDASSVPKVMMLPASWEMTTFVREAAEKLGFLSAATCQVLLLPSRGAIEDISHIRDGDELLITICKDGLPVPPSEPIASTSIDGVTLEINPVSSEPGEMRSYRICILGAGGVGKSAVTMRLLKDVFLIGYDPTLDERFQHVMRVDGEEVMLDILDTAGQEEFHSMLGSWLADRDGFLIVYSVTTAATFDNLDYFVQAVHDCHDEHIAMVLVANKCDKIDEREVSEQEGEAYAASHGSIPFVQTSAKSGSHIQTAFEALVREIRRKQHLTSAYPHGVQQDSSNACCNHKCSLQ